MLDLLTLYGLYSVRESIRLHPGHLAHGDPRQVPDKERVFFKGNPMERLTVKDSQFVVSIYIRIRHVI